MKEKVTTTNETNHEDAENANVDIVSLWETSFMSRVLNTIQNTI